jgi:hypothetical protein
MLCRRSLPGRKRRVPSLREDSIPRGRLRRFRAALQVAEREKSFAARERGRAALEPKLGS